MKKQKEQLEKEMPDELVFIGTGKKWELGKPCITPTIRNGNVLKEEIGVIIYDRDERFGPMYSGRDTQGQEIFGASFQMKDVTNQFVENKDRLLAQVRAINEERDLDPVRSRTTVSRVPQPQSNDAVPSPYASKLLKTKSRDKKLRAINKGKEKSKSRTR